jgi:hypothetical protein
MTKTWRAYRRLSPKAQAAIAAAILLLAIIGAAAGGSSKSTTKTASQIGSTATTSSTTEAPTTTGAPLVPVPATTPPPTVAEAAASGCHSAGSGEMVRPDRECTPGAANPDVTQANIAATICTSGWTATIRPPESYTEPLKRQQMAAYGDTEPISSYEEDHLVPLEVGGAPSDPRNLWPELGASPNPKDKVENAAQAAVCGGRITLAAAQQGFESDWIAFGEQLGVSSSSTPPPAPVAPTATLPPPTPAPAPTPTNAVTVSCSPVTSTGKCYTAGEKCPTADEGSTGTDANGLPITCRNVNGWRWEH